MMSIEKRIRLLEQNAADLPWPDTTINLFVCDGRRTPDPEPDQLTMVVKAGSPQRRGKVFHRRPDESETDFIERTRT
jgi:hypothetical protein